jgi:hypothetical protein
MNREGKPVLQAGKTALEKFTDLGVPTSYTPEAMEAVRPRKENGFTCRIAEGSNAAADPRPQLAGSRRRRKGGSGPPVAADRRRHSWRGGGRSLPGSSERSKIGASASSRAENQTGGWTPTAAAETTATAAAEAATEATRTGRGTESMGTVTPRMLICILHHAIGTHARTKSKTTGQSYKTTTMLKCVSPLFSFLY